MERIIESIDDIPLIYSFIDKLLITNKLDLVYPIPKNWQSPSIGCLTKIWLTYIITECNHRLSHVEDWAEARLGLLCTLTDSTIRREDFSDDKLGLLLEYFSEGQLWNTFMQNHTQNVIQMYDLNSDIFRLDATIGKSFKKVVEGGLFQMGDSKQFRPDLAQFKLMLSTLDPIGQPIASLIVSGQHADDPLYIPVIKQTIATTSAKGKLFVGDKKLSALETRSYIVSTQNYYLSPLSAVQVPQAQLLEYISPLLNGKQEVVHVYKGKDKIAKGYELTVTINDEVNGKTVEWKERRLIVLSYQYANSQIRTLVEHVWQAKKVLLELPKRKQGKPLFKKETELDSACIDTLKQYKVEGIVEYLIDKQITIKQIRSYKGKPARVEEIINFGVDVKINEAALNQRKSILGWRVYATNCPVSKFTLEAAVLVYRNEYVIEHCFNNLKNTPLELLPIFLHRDDRIKGLINLLILALSVIRLMEYKVKTSMVEKGIDFLQGLYPGNPKQKCKNPTVTRLFSAFDNKFCSLMEEADAQQQVVTPTPEVSDIQTDTPEVQSSSLHLLIEESKEKVVDKKTMTKIFVSSLTLLQLTIIELLGLSAGIYTDLEKNYLSTYKIVEGKALYNVSRKIILRQRSVTIKTNIEKQFQGQCSNFNSG